MRQRSFLLIFLFAVLATVLCPENVYAKRVVLDVPFTPQAPTGLWEEPWQNACEETAVTMVNAYYSEMPLSEEEAVEAIRSTMAAKEQLYGGSKDESVETLAAFIEERYTWDAVVKTEVALEDIQKEITAGRPVIFPFDATKVNNPAYGEPPPAYHVVVIIGYDNEAQEFVAHDPGISAGKEFHYDYDTLLDANASYRIRDTGEERGSDALFTSPNEEWQQRIQQWLVSTSQKITRWWRLIF